MVSFEAWRSGKRLFVAGAERVGVLLTSEHVSPGDEIVLRVVEAPVAGDSGGARPRVTGAAIKELLAHLASLPDRKVVITARGRPVAALNEPDNKAPGVSCSFCGKAQAHVAKVIAGPTAYICNECVELSALILVEEGF